MEQLEAFLATSDVLELVLAKLTHSCDRLAWALTCRALRGALRDGALVTRGAKSPSQASWLVEDMGVAVRSLQLAAARDGEAGVLEWTIHREPVLLRGAAASKVCAAAAAGGHLDCIKIARAHGCPWDGQTTCAAALGGHEETLQYVVAEGAPWEHRMGPPRNLFGLPRNACSAAARAANLPLLVWCRERGCPWDEGTCSEAGGVGATHVLEFLREAGCPMDRQTCAAAALGGHLETLKWACSNGCPWRWDAFTCTNVAAAGHVPVLEWLRAQGAPWGRATCEAAARAGHLHMLKYLKSSGCPLDEAVCRAAALGGHMEVLRWAVAEGAPLGEGVCLAASSGGRLCALRYLIDEARCPWDARACYDEARRGLTMWSASASTCTGAGQVEVSRWIASQL